MSEIIKCPTCGFAIKVQKGQNKTLYRRCKAIITKVMK